METNFRSPARPLDADGALNAPWSRAPSTAREPNWLRWRQTIRYAGQRSQCAEEKSHNIKARRGPARSIKTPPGIMQIEYANKTPNTTDPIFTGSIPY